MQVNPQEFGEVKATVEANHEMLVNITKNGTTASASNSLNIKWVWRTVLLLGVAVKAGFWFLYIQINSSTGG